MKKYKILFIILNIICTVNGQELWNIDPIDEGEFQMISDLSIDSIENIIINDQWDSDPTIYIAAAKYLLYFHSNTHKEFLLENLYTEIDTTKKDANSHLQWDKHYTDIYIKGILGDLNALSKMDSLVKQSPKESIKVSAIKKLAEAGHYDYWEYVKNNKGEIDVSNIFLLYGKDGRFKNQVIEYYEEQLQNLDPNDWNRVLMVTHNVGFLNPSREIELIENYFYNTTGKTRYYYYGKLNLLDQMNQTSRSIWAISNEPEENIRSLYFPVLLEKRTFLDSEGFYSPLWINFIKEWLKIETSSLIKSYIKMNMIDFKPIKQDSVTSIKQNVDYLYHLIDTIYQYMWLGNEDFQKFIKNLIVIASNNLDNGDSLSCAVKVKEFQDAINNVYTDSLNPDPRFVTAEGWKFLYWNAQYILDRLPAIPDEEPGLKIKLISSTGNLLTGGSLQYYEGSWKDAINNNDGTFRVETERTSISLRMYYEYGSQTLSNIPVRDDTVIFQTVNAQIQLQNSQGNLVDEGTVQYYAGAWRNFGTTVNGIASKELLPNNYSFRMTYAYGSNDKQQNIGDNPVVTFQTINAQVQLQNSLGSLVDEGIVQYYAGAWREFGTTLNGTASKELLPNNYSFRMTYEFVSNDKQQNLNDNPVVVFQTVLCTVKVSNAAGEPVDNASIQYYAGAWRNFGTTPVGAGLNEEVTKELLPANLSFRARVGALSQDKQQNIGVNKLVEFIF